MTELIPFSNKVLVKKDKNKETTEGGIVLPECYTNEKINPSQIGTVVAVGPGLTTYAGVFVPTTVKVGQRIVFDKSNVTEAKELGEDLVIVPESGIYCIINEVE